MTAGPRRASTESSALRTVSLRRRRGQPVVRMQQPVRQAGFHGKQQEEDGQARERGTARQPAAAPSPPPSHLSGRAAGPQGWPGPSPVTRERPPPAARRAGSGSRTRPRAGAR
jgi:hypothetical protein